MLIRVRSRDINLNQETIPVFHSECITPAVHDAQQRCFIRAPSDLRMRTFRQPARNPSSGCSHRKPAERLVEECVAQLGIRLLEPANQMQKEFYTSKALEGHE